MIRELRNSIDFFIRQKITWGRPLDPQTPDTEMSRKLQNEVLEFFSLFQWDQAIRDYLTPRSILRVADVGAKTFVFAKPISELFAKIEKTTVIHGIEIDAYRRYTSLRTRFDYGMYYAQQVPNTYYHAMDFLNWKSSLDVTFMLHPFVTTGPLLAWGLPLRHFKPQALFKKTAEVMVGGGLLFVSSPTEEESEICIHLAKDSGYELFESRKWEPSEKTVQQLPRIGHLFYLRNRKTVGLEIGHDD